MYKNELSYVLFNLEECLYDMAISGESCSKKLAKSYDNNLRKLLTPNCLSNMPDDVKKIFDFLKIELIENIYQQIKKNDLEEAKSKGLKRSWMTGTDIIKYNFHWTKSKKIIQKITNLHHLLNDYYIELIKKPCQQAELINEKD